MQSATWPELWIRSILHKVVILDLDIHRSANLLVTRHGEDAPIEAANWTQKPIYERQRLSL